MEEQIGMHIGAKPIENLLMIMVLKKNTLQEHKSQKTSFYKFCWPCLPRQGYCV